MKKYTVKEVADEIGVAPQLIRSKMTRKSFPKEYVTRLVNEQNREVAALTEEGLKLLKDEYRVVDESVNDENKALLGQLKLVKQGDFLGTKCDFYKDEQNNIYMTREQIGRALEYKNDNQIKMIHNKNSQLDDLSVEISRFNKGYQSSNPYSAPENKRNTQTIDDLMLSKLHPDTLLYNEDGIYEITFLSRQPRANEFRAWVRERIKEIRKFGFTTATDKQGNHDFEPMINLMFGEGESIGKTAFKQAITRIEDLLEDNEKQKDIITQQKETLDEQKPVYEFGEKILISEDYATIGTIANMLSNNGIDIGAQRLRKWLREKGVIAMEWNGYQNQYRASQYAINNGWAVTEQRPFSNNGFNGLSIKPLFKPKGQQWIIKKIFEEKEGGRDSWS